MVKYRCRVADICHVQGEVGAYQLVGAYLVVSAWPTGGCEHRGAMRRARSWLRVPAVVHARLAHPSARGTTTNLQEPVLRAKQWKERYDPILASGRG